MELLDMTYRYMIVDSDSSSAYEVQQRMLEYEEFQHIASCNEQAESLNTILKEQPTLVILNLDKNPAAMFSICLEAQIHLKEVPIFIGISTKKDAAFDAIKNGFFDYWLLPTTELDIRKTILKLRIKLEKEKEAPTLCLKSYKDFHYLNTDDILYLKADNNTTDFYLKDGKKVSAYKTLKSFEQSLPKNFIRIHQSYILNTKHVSRINFGKNTCAIKNSEEKLPFSKSYREKIDTLKNILSKNAIRTLG